MYHTKTLTMKLKVSQDSFTEILQGINASGVTFEGIEEEGWIVITFTGEH